LPLALPIATGACATSGGTDATAGTPSSSGLVTPVNLSEAPTSEASSWLDIELIDAVTGETFTLASLAGQVVAIEPMAIWCPTCKAQQDDAKQALADASAGDVQYISLGVDPNEDARSLADYADQHGYDWTFARAPTRFARALADQFGPQVLSPPSTPLIVLDASGEVIVREFGRHGPRELLALLDEAATG
jgi:cytochrome oxidase Cu insertion factor (SCO1/SenC/PrrC family)